jgi:hypothetical protein
MYKVTFTLYSCLYVFSTTNINGRNRGIICYPASQRKKKTNEIENQKKRNVKVEKPVPVPIRRKERE